VRGCVATGSADWREEGGVELPPCASACSCGKERVKYCLAVTGSGDREDSTEGTFETLKSSRGSRCLLGICVLCFMKKK